MVFPSVHEQLYGIILDLWKVWLFLHLHFSSQKVLIKADFAGVERFVFKILLKIWVIVYFPVDFHSTANII